ncbi:MAG: cyclic dehypoxanthinyl futalosine synthase [Candidatus Sumerlaeia bacterium]
MGDSTLDILEKSRAGERLTLEDARALFAAPPDRLHELGAAAHAVRMRLHPEPFVTYIIDRNINYTNVCVARCRFCAFYRKPGDADGYVLSKEALFDKIRETIALGGNQTLLQGGHHPRLPLEWYEDLLRSVKREFPGFHLHAFSPPEIIHLTKISRLPLDEVLSRLIAAGLDSIPGGGAEILNTALRNELDHRGRGKTTAEEWIEVMRSAHRLGLRTTATMMFGHIETLEHRVEHLARLRDLQDETGGFTAFICWTFEPENTDMAHIPRASGWDYLRTLAISRLFLDNIANVQASWVTQGQKIGQMALLFGANDMGSLMIEENVVSAAGCSYEMSVETLEHLIRDAGFEPRRRDFFYRLLPPGARRVPEGEAQGGVAGGLANGPAAPPARGPHSTDAAPASAAPRRP